MEPRAHRMEPGHTTDGEPGRKRQSSSEGRAASPLTFESFYLTLPLSPPLSFARATSKGRVSSEGHAPSLLTLEF